ncbi:MAG: hypothetical protein LC772_07525 [Chloroflexi bacterium]|nr:hypothetical protein [Chloroflexota bacterium]
MFLSRLSALENSTWGEIKGRENHFVQVGTLIKKARDRLRVIGHEDQDALMSLRLGGTERLWGMMDGHLFLILWWDPDHEVAPSHKRHT